MTEDLGWLLKVVREQGSSFTLLVLVLYGGYKRLWVWGRELADSEARCSVWKDLYLRAAETLTSAVQVAARK